jgi:hypothetical protein
MIVSGTLGLVLALVWAMAFLYQRDSVSLLMAMVVANSPIAVKISNLWSVLQTWIPAVLAIPVAALSIGTMLGARLAAGALRVALVATAVLSAGTLVIYASLAAPRAIAGGPILLANPRINYELLVAAVTLGLQIALLVLHRRIGRNDAGSDEASLANSRTQKPNKPLQPTSGTDNRGRFERAVSAARG